MLLPQVTQQITVHKKAPRCSSHSCLLTPLRMMKELEPHRVQAVPPGPPCGWLLIICLHVNALSKHQVNHQALGSSGHLCSLQLPEPLFHCRCPITLP